MISGSDSFEETPAEEFRRVPRTSAYESPLNTRKHFDQVALDELTASVRQKGVLVPLLVRINPSNGREFEVLAGARRLRAADAAEVADIPIRVIVANDDEALEIIVLENLQREDVHPLEEAEGYRALLERSGYDVAAIAAKVGKSESYLYQRLKLLDLIPAAQKAFLASEITAGHAVLIARLQPKDQELALRECFDTQQVRDDKDRWRAVNVLCGVRALALWIESEIHLDLSKVPFDTGDATLLPGAGACATCPKRTGFAPALFHDIAKKDTCTDRACFHAKMAAHVEQKKAELQAQGEKLVELSSDWRPSKEHGKALGSEKWKPAPASGKNTCEHVVKGIMVDGRELGKVQTVCTNEKCSKHSRGYGYSSGHSSPKPSAAEQKKRRLENLKQRRRGEVIRRSFRAIKEAAPTKITRAELVSVVAGYFEEMQQDALIALCAAYDVEVEKHKHQYGGTTRDPGKSLAKWIDGLTDAKLTQLLLALPATRDLNFSPWHTSEPKRIHAAGERWGVDLKAVEKTVDAEFREKEKRIREAAAKKAAKKGKGSKPAKTKGATNTNKTKARGKRVHASAKSAAGAEASAR